MNEIRFKGVVRQGGQASYPRAARGRCSAQQAVSGSSLFMGTGRSLQHNAAMNVTKILFNQVERRPEALALRHVAGDLTYAEVGARVARVAAALADAGLTAHQVVAIALDDPLEHWTATLAVAHVGATVLSLTGAMAQAQREQLMRQTACAYAIAEEESPASTAPTGVPVLHWSAVLAQCTDRCLPPAGVTADQPWLYVSGSGSTGQPKVIPITHRQEWARTRSAAAGLPYEADDIVYPMLGMGFSSAKRRSLEAWCCGCAIYLAKAAPLALSDLVLQKRISVIHTTVFHTESLLAQLPPATEGWLQNAKALFLGASLVSHHLRLRIQKQLTPRLYVRYGANETGTISVAGPDTVFAAESGVGWPSQGVRVQVVDDQGASLPAGVDGHIRVSSPTLSQGYLGDPEATGKAFRDGWFYPGDIGHFTTDGQLVHRGRADDMMIVSGVNVYPAQVQECLRAFPGVADVLVTPLLHRQLQQMPVALVVAAPGTRLDARALVQHVQARLGRHTLYDLFLVERIARNEQGKVQREALTHILRSKWGGTTMPEQARPTHQWRSARSDAHTFTVAFVPPPQLQPQALGAWRALLDGQGVPEGTPPATPATAEAVPAWLHQVFGLVQSLLHVLRIPVFEPIGLLACQPVAPAGARWEAVCQSPDPSLVDVALLEGLVSMAFGLATWAQHANVHAAPDRARFFQRIEQDVRQAFARFAPKGKSTFEVLRVAHQRGVPYRALPGGAFQLGWGAQARRIDRSTTDHDCALGVRWTLSKRLTAQMLSQAGLPAPRHASVATLQQARQCAERFGYPVVVKPDDLERGEGVSVDVRAEGLEAAFKAAHHRSPGKKVLVEQQVPGVCHRLFIAAGKLLYAVRRLPMGVYADGRSTIHALVAAECEAQQALPPWKRSGIRPLDVMALHMVHRQGWSPDAVPPAGRFVALRRIETTAWGGIDEDVSRIIHPHNLSAALAAADLFGLEVAGVDMISPDIRQPWHANGAIINEVNYAPLLGGGEISRAHIGTYLDRIVPGRGLIPVHVYLGAEGARTEAHRHWVQLRACGVQACLVDRHNSLGPDGNACAIASGSLEATVQALLLRREVQALVIAAPAMHWLGAGASRWPFATVRVVDADASHPPGH